MEVVVIFCISLLIILLGLGLKLNIIFIGLVVFVVSLVYLLFLKHDNIKNKYDDFNVIYINLENRKDRNKQFIRQLKGFSTNYKRLNATYHEDFGALGCSKSHIRCLENAIQEDLDNVLVFEDDFKFIRNKRKVYDEITNFIKNEKTWDVLLLSCNMEERTPYNKIVDKVTNSQTASGYLVNKHYYKKRLQFGLGAVELGGREGGSTGSGG